MVTRSKQRRARAQREVHRAGAALAVAALAVAVAACGSGTQEDSGGSSGGSSGGGNVTLTLKHITDNKPALTKLIAEYKKVAPNVTIQASYAPVDDLQTSLRAQLGGGNAPDLFVVWPGNGSAMSVQQLAPSGVLADISDQGWIGNVPENLRPLLGSKDKTYMWSSGVTPIGAIYNKQVFKEAGIAETPKTWSEFLADAEKIKAKGKIPIALGNQTPWVTQLIPYAIAPSTAFKDDPKLAEDMLAGKKSFSNSGWHTVFERYLELEKKGFFNKSPNGTTFEQQQALVGSGKAAMAIQVTSVATGIQDAAKNKADIATFPFPAADDEGDLKIPAGVSAGVGASAKGKNLEAAKKFLDWLGKPENMASYAEANQSIPLVGAGDATLSDIAAPFAPFVADGKTVPFMDQQWPNAKVQPVHFAGIQELFAGKTDVKGLLAKLDEAYDQK
jgi:raffinose/stachyose/melibiose transport system substrate-binding protein